LGSQTLLWLLVITTSSHAIVISWQTGCDFKFEKKLLSCKSGKVMKTRIKLERWRSLTPWIFFCCEASADGYVQLGRLNELRNHRGSISFRCATHEWVSDHQCAVGRPSHGSMTVPRFAAPHHTVAIDTSQLLLQHL